MWKRARADLDKEEKEKEKQQIWSKRDLQLLM